MPLRQRALRSHRFCRQKQEAQPFQVAPLAFGFQRLTANSLFPAQQIKSYRKDDKLSAKYKQISESKKQVTRG
jgi:hypothetical protein